MGAASLGLMAALRGPRPGPEGLRGSHLPPQAVGWRPALLPSPTGGDPEGSLNPAGQAGAAWGGVASSGLFLMPPKEVGGIAWSVSLGGGLS